MTFDTPMSRRSLTCGINVEETLHDRRRRLRVEQAVRMATRDGPVHDGLLLLLVLLAKCDVDATKCGLFVLYIAFTRIDCLRLLARLSSQHKNAPPPSPLKKVRHDRARPTAAQGRLPHAQVQRTALAPHQRRRSTRQIGLRFKYRQRALARSPAPCQPPSDMTSCPSPWSA